MITVRDLISNESATVDQHDLADTIRPWYPEAPAEVLEAVESLQIALLRGEPTGDLEQYLQVKIERD